MRQPLLEAQPNHAGAMAMATFAGIFAAFVGAALWIVVAQMTGYEIGYAAVAVGWLVGWAIRQFKKSMSGTYGMLGAIISLVGIALGLTGNVVAYFAAHERIDFVTALGRLPVDRLLQAVVSDFDAMTLLFVVIAVVAGYRVAMGRPPAPRTPGYGGGPPAAAA